MAQREYQSMCGANKMKIFCRYVVIDIKTGYALACGERYKDFEKTKIRYINNGSFRTGFFRRKITEYFRTLEIVGRECVIIYWANTPKGKTYNYAYPFKNGYPLRAKNYFVDPSDYGFLIEDLGVGYENV